MLISPNVPEQQRLFRVPVDEFVIKVSYADTKSVYVFSLIISGITLNQRDTAGDVTEDPVSHLINVTNEEYIHADIFVCSSL